MGAQSENEQSERISQAERFARDILDSLSAHIAILNRDGVIVTTNRAWREFASDNQIRMRPDTLGVNYLDLCDSATGEFAERARGVATGIRAVIAGEQAEFVIDYPCHSPDQKRWFYMRATRLSGSDPLRVVVSHEDITALKTFEETLTLRERELERQAESLTEANIALKVLLDQRERDRRELEENVVTNVRNFVLPSIQQLKDRQPEERRMETLEILESHLNTIVSPFLRRLSLADIRLTPQEIKIAALVRDGQTTKDIARVLCISTSAVDFHRKNIRKKLGIRASGGNLRSHLLELSKR